MVIPPNYSPLAAWTVIGGALALYDPLDRCSTPYTGLAMFFINAQLLPEITGFAV